MNEICNKCGWHKRYGNQANNCACVSAEAPLVPTLRDRFAMAALPGVAATNNYSSPLTALAAYKIADCMLKAREIK